MRVLVGLEKNPVESIQEIHVFDYDVLLETSQPEELEDWADMEFAMWTIREAESA